MNKTLVLITLAVLLLATFAVSTVAASAEKVAVEATQAGSIVPGSSGSWRITDGGRLTLQNWAGGGVITLTIPGKGTFNGTSTSVDIGTVNLATGDSSILLKSIWNFGSTGTFVGEIHLKGTGASFANPSGTYLVNAHAVFQGTGSFEGQTLMLSYQGAKPPISWEGFLLIH